VIEDGCLSPPLRVVPKTEETSEQEPGPESKPRLELGLEPEFSGDALTSEQLQELDSISAGTKDSTVLEIRPALTKTQRTSFHREFIRNGHTALDSKTETGGSDDCTRIFVFQRGARSVAQQQQRGEQHSPGSDAPTTAKKREKRQAVVQRWDASKPDYLHFTLCKNLMGTDEALELLSKKLGVLPSRFSVSGSKDRYAITAQRACVWRVEAEKLHAYVAEMESRKAAGLPVQVMISDVAPAARPLGLGALTGNLFCVTLRSPLSPLSSSSSSLEEVQALTQTLQTQQKQQQQQQQQGASEGVPFLNLFGPQRFGTPLPVNVAVGQAVLQGNYRKAVLLLLLCPGSNAEVTLGSLSLPLLSQWLAEAEMGEGGAERCKHFPLEDRWEQYAQELVASINSGVHSNTLNPTTADNLLRRLDFLSALVSDDSTRLVDSPTPRALPFAQRKLCDNILAQLATAVKAREKKEKEKEGVVEGPLSALQCVDFKKCFQQSLPRNLRQLFVNAYQSEIFNSQARDIFLERIVGEGEDGGGIRSTESVSESLTRVLSAQAQQAQARAGDVVLLDRDGRALTAWDVSLKNVTLVANAVPLFEAVHCDSGELKRLKSGKRQGFVHIVTKEEEHSGAYTLDNVVGVLPGHHTEGMGLHNVAASRINADGCRVLLTGEHDDSVFRLPGAYRHVISRARNFRVVRASVGDDGGDDDAAVGDHRSSDTDEEILPVHGFSDRAEAMMADGTLAQLVRTLRSLRSVMKASKKGGDNGNYQSKGEGDEGGAAVDLLFSLCSSSYATTFTSCLLGTTKAVMG
jgi:tRNA(Glu) U13 pseudouridine synthase TruD